MPCRPCLGRTLDPARTPARLEADLAARRHASAARARSASSAGQRACTTPETWHIRLTGATSPSPTRSAPPSGPAARWLDDRRLLPPVRQPCGPLRCDLLSALRTAYGDAPRDDAELPTCPICYRTVDDDGRPGSLELPGLRVDLRRTWSSTIVTRSATTSGSKPFVRAISSAGAAGPPPIDTVRRYLVTGQLEAGRNRQLAHDLIVTAMTQLRRWGPSRTSSATSPPGRPPGPPSPSSWSATRRVAARRSAQRR